MKEWIRILLDIVCTTILLIMITISILYIKGIKPTIMVTGSMNPEIPIGNLCFVDTNYDYEKIQINDIIIYKVPKQKVMHRVVSKNENGYKTKGDANQKVDKAVITRELYLGKYLFSIPKIGLFFQKVQTPISKAIFITFLISLYIIDYLMHYAEKNRFKIKQQKMFSN